METTKGTGDGVEKKGSSKLLFLVMLVLIVAAVVVTALMSHPHVGDSGAGNTRQASPSQSH